MTLMAESLRLNSNPFAGVIQRGKERLDQLSRAAQEGIIKAQAVGSYVVANREQIAKTVAKNTIANVPAMAAGAATRIGLTVEVGVLGASTAASVVALPAVAVAVGVGSAVAKYGIEDKRLKKIGAKAFFDLHAGRHMKAEEAEKPQARGIAGSILHAVKKAGDFAAHGLEERTVSDAFKVEGRRKKVEKVTGNITYASASGQSVFEHYQSRVARVFGSANTQFQNKVALRMLKKDTQDAFIAYVTATNLDVKAKARTAYLSLRDVQDSSTGQDIHLTRQARKAELRREIGKNAKSAVRGMANIQLVKAPLRVATGAFLAEKALGALGFVKDRAVETVETVQNSVAHLQPQVVHASHASTADFSHGGLPPSSGDNGPIAITVSNVKSDQSVTDVSTNTPMSVKKADLSPSPVKLDYPSPPLHPQVEPPADPPPAQPPQTVTLPGGQKIPVYSPSGATTTGETVKVGNTDIPVYKPAAVKDVASVVNPPTVTVTANTETVTNNPPYVPSTFNPGANLKPPATDVIPTTPEVVTTIPSVPTTSVAVNTAPEFVTLPNGVKIPVYKPASVVVSADTIRPPTAAGVVTPSTTVFRNDSVVFGQTEIPVYKPPVSDTVAQAADHASTVVNTLQSEPVSSFASLDLASSASKPIAFSSNHPEIFPPKIFRDWKFDVNLSTPVEGEVTYFYDPAPDQGGLVAFPHSGFAANERGDTVEQVMETVRRYIEGGNNGVARLADAQKMKKITELIQTKPQITLSQGGKTVALELADASLMSRDEVYNQFGGDISKWASLGGSKDTITFIFCTRSYADGIKIFDTVADAIPASLKAEFAVLHSPTATGDQVQNAVVKLAKWLETHDKSAYMEFRKLYDYYGKPSSDIQREFPDMYTWGRAKLTFRVVKP